MRQKAAHLVLSLWLALMAMSLHRVDKGHFALYFRGGRLLPRTSTEGWHLKLPFWDTVQMTAFPTSPVVIVVCDESVQASIRFWCMDSCSVSSVSDWWEWLQKEWTLVRDNNTTGPMDFLQPQDVSKAVRQNGCPGKQELALVFCKQDFPHCTPQLLHGWFSKEQKQLYGSWIYTKRDSGQEVEVTALSRDGDRSFSTDIEYMGLLSDPVRRGYVAPGYEHVLHPNMMFF